MERCLPKAALLIKQLRAHVYADLKDHVRRIHPTIFKHQHSLLLVDNLTDDRLAQDLVYLILDTSAASFRPGTVDFLQREHQMSIKLANSTAQMLWNLEFWNKQFVTSTEQMNSNAKKDFFDVLEERFGWSVSDMMKMIIKYACSVHGSGWTWLLFQGNRLYIANTFNAGKKSPKSELNLCSSHICYFFIDSPPFMLDKPTEYSEESSRRKKGTEEKGKDECTVHINQSLLLKSQLPKTATKPSSLVDKRRSLLTSLISSRSSDDSMIDSQSIIVKNIPLTRTEKKLADVDTYDCLKNSSSLQETASTIHSHTSDFITPILVFNLWEHAFIGDFGLNREAYVRSCLDHANWTRALSNLSSAHQ